MGADESRRDEPSAEIDDPARLLDGLPPAAGRTLSMRPSRTRMTASAKDGACPGVSVNTLPFTNAVVPDGVWPRPAVFTAPKSSTADRTRNRTEQVDFTVPYSSFTSRSGSSASRSCAKLGGLSCGECSSMVEHRTVAPVVAGSIPVTHPKYSPKPCIDGLTIDDVLTIDLPIAGMLDSRRCASRTLHQSDRFLNRSIRQFVYRSIPTLSE